LCSCRLGWVKEEEAGAGAGATKGDSTPHSGELFCFVLFIFTESKQSLAVSIRGR